MKLVRHLLAIAGIAAAVLAVTATSVQASYTQCPSMYVCLFGVTEGGGTPLDIVYRSPGTCYTVAIVAANNRARSVYNHLSNGHHVQFYDAGNCTGSVHVNCCAGNPVPAGTKTNVNFSDWDLVSSIWFNNG